MQAIISQHVNKIFTRLGERGYEFPDEEDKNFLNEVFTQTLREFSQTTSQPQQADSQSPDLASLLSALQKANNNTNRRSDKKR